MKAPLTVLQVGAFPFPLPLGSQVYARGMGVALARRGHRVLLACYPQGEGPDPDGLQVHRPRPLPGVGFVGSGPHPSKLPNDLLLWGLLRRLLRRHRVDVVHAHHVEAPLLARLARLRRRPPLVFSPHTELAEELPSWFGGPWAGVLARAGGALDRLVTASADAVVALSERAAEAARSRGARRVALLPPGVDPAELAGGDAARARLGEGPWVIYAGNADAYQDLPVLFAAMARVQHAGLLLVTGDAPAPLRDQALRAGVRRLRVVHTRAFPEVRDALCAAAVGVLPRARCAGFPIKLLNQLGLGLPTVAVRGAVPQLPGVLTVPPADPAAMARAIDGLLADESRRRALGEAARAEVLRGWTWAARAEDLEALYRELVGAAG